MKTPKILLLSAVAVFTTVHVPWKAFDNLAVKLSTSWWSYPDEKNLHNATGEGINSLAEEEDEFTLAPEEDGIAPPAEDVLIQKIPGDNNHLLMMAFYSKENYSGKFINIENGGHLVFRDDGNGYDKKAGDGFYTAKIAVDLNEFRQKVLRIIAQMEEKSYMPLRFDHRAIIVDPDAGENFDRQKWERGELVSISGLTNALADLDLSADAASSKAAGTTLPSVINAIEANSITITNTGVVEDPTRTWNSCTQKGNINGPWTFKTIMKQLASKDPAHIATDAQISNFVKNWLSNWATTRVINGDTVKARTAVNAIILNPWLSKSQKAGAPVGQLDMRFAPFKLTAIVNRFDLREGGVHGIGGRSVGEGRYVFCLINSTCTDALRMGVILEFGINRPVRATCDVKKAWALQWVALKDLTIGSSAYNQALQKITDQYTLCGTNPGRPNQSSLDQLRTNEIALSPSSQQVWEMREFVLDPAGSGFLKESTVAQNPSDKYNAQVNNANVLRMAQYVNQNMSAITADTSTVPLTWNGFPFLGAATKLTAPPTGKPPAVFHWDGTKSSADPAFIKSSIARFHFSQSTCWGCHGGETQTGFTHIDPVFYGKEATLSGFLTGRAGKNGAVDFDGNPDNGLFVVKDPALRPTGNPTMRAFNDILRRARDLNTVAQADCGTVLGISADLLFKPVNDAD